MERELYDDMAISGGERHTVERQRRRRALTAAWVIVGGLYAAIVACSVLIQNRATGSVAELPRVELAEVR